MKICKALNCLMPNLNGPSSSKRRMYVSAVLSMVLYAAPIWSGILKYKKYRDMLMQVQRAVLIRVTRAYRITSSEALWVVGGIPSL